MRKESETKRSIAGNLASDPRLRRQSFRQALEQLPSGTASSPCLGRLLTSRYTATVELLTARQAALGACHVARATDGLDHATPCHTHDARRVC